MKTIADKHNSAPFKKGDTIDIDISALDSEGNGIGIADRRQVRVVGALPGEKVKAKISHVGTNKISAQTVRIISPSAMRINSSCRVTKECDGCSLINMQYSAELTWKHEQVANRIHCHTDLVDTTILPVIASPQELNYRNSAKLVVGGRYNAPLIGIYKRGSHDIVDISACPLHHPLINRIVAAVKTGIVKGRVPVFHPRSGEGLLRYLVVRVAEQENRAMVIFVVANRSYNEIHHLAAFVAKEVPEIAVMAQNINQSAGNVILGDKDIIITKEKSLLATLNGIRFLVSPRSFFQINSGSAAIIYRKVVEFAALSGGETVLDLYCGSGAISLHLSKKAASVLGIEVVEEAVQDAATNAKLNRTNNCAFIAGDAAKLLHKLKSEQADIDVVILNPPRKGCEASVLKHVAALAPQKIIYVSCSPETLGRDLQLLSELGYKTSQIQPVDLFPHTPHIENVALLTSK
ncbi:MAG: 23S rRNA (uracil(1939)-C(5))-methyltransferase RlmD [Geobacter sp.]|nr:23S rRNA (uracil(1939)-C(5))-methyltransferase RlmD [Geobacter sp.]